MYCAPVDTAKKQELDLRMAEVTSQRDELLKKRDELIQEEQELRQNHEPIAAEGVRAFLQTSKL